MAGAIGRRSFIAGISGVMMAGNSRASDASVVEIDTGKLGGVTEGGVSRFIGIPYAAPPVGALRYRSPVAAAPWSGVRDATKPGAASIQTLGGAAAWLYEGAEPQGEDCLFLNVWTPAAKGARKPVMVWLHGGAWRTGHGMVAGTNGALLSQIGDVVVVTVNYRLGALGWLAHPDLKDPTTGAFANWGHQDQIAALRWVQRNIAAFGGDPGNVTIFGQSAGGQSVASIAQNPANKGLFHKAIIESGSLHGAPGFPEVATAAAYAEALAKRLNTTIAGLGLVSAKQLHDTELQLGRDPAMVRSLGRPPILPVLDDNVLKAWPRDGALPEGVPLLIGTTRTEGSFWFDLVGPDGKLVPGLASPQTDADLEPWIKDIAAIYRPEGPASSFAEVAAAYRAAAGEAGEAITPKSLWVNIYTDVVFRLRALAAAKRHAAAGNTTYLYEFQHPLFAPAHGVPHTAEIPFVFGTYKHPFFASKVGAGETEAALSDAMLRSWAAFAHDGVPKAPQAEKWMPATASAVPVNLLGGAGALLGVAPSVRPTQTAAWKI